MRLTRLEVKALACDHVGGPELIEMAESYLRNGGVPENAWPGSKFRFAQNLTEGMWPSICVEIERRGEQWIVTRLDRNKAALNEGETGFKILVLPRTA